MEMYGARARHCRLSIKYKMTTMDYVSWKALFSTYNTLLQYIYFIGWESEKERKGEQDEAKNAHTHRECVRCSFDVGLVSLVC